MVDGPRPRPPAQGPIQPALLAARGNSTESHVDRIACEPPQRCPTAAELIGQRSASSTQALHASSDSQASKASDAGMSHPASPGSAVTDVVEPLPPGSMKTRRLTLMSFGFKYGHPPANYYFDASFLKNPAREDGWDLFSSVSPRMREFVLSQPRCQQFLDKLTPLLEVLPRVRR